MTVRTNVTVNLKLIFTARITEEISQISQVWNSWRFTMETRICHLVSETGSDRILQRIGAGGVDALLRYSQLA